MLYRPARLGIDSLGSLKGLQIRALESLSAFCQLSYLALWPAISAPADVPPYYSASSVISSIQSHITWPFCQQPHPCYCQLSEPTPTNISDPPPASGLSSSPYASIPIPAILFYQQSYHSNHPATASNAIFPNNLLVGCTLPTVSISPCQPSPPIFGHIYTFSLNFAASRLTPFVCMPFRTPCNKNVHKFLNLFIPSLSDTGKNLG